MAAHGFPQGGVLLHGLEDVVEVVDDHLAFDSTTAGLPGGMPVVPMVPAYRFWDETGSAGLPGWSIRVGP